MEITNDDGEKVTVYTADEVAAREAAAKESVTTEFTAKLTEAETEKKRLEGILGEQAGNFNRFNKLSEEQEAKLSNSEREKYEVQKALNEANESIASLRKEGHQSKIDSVIAAQCGNDPKLIEKTKAMYEKINLPDSTPEELAARVKASFGAIAPSEPSVASFLASTAGNGSYTPPTEKTQVGEAPARIKNGAAELGLKI